MGRHAESHVPRRDCDVCGKAISEARLEALPETTLCIECAKKFPPPPIDPAKLDISQAGPITRNGFAPSD